MTVTVVFIDGTTIVVTPKPGAPLITVNDVFNTVKAKLTGSKDPKDPKDPSHLRFIDPQLNITYQPGDSGSFTTDRRIYAYFKCMTTI
jgi:hypothetical protein